jgi:hypothetical protein
MGQKLDRDGFQAPDPAWLPSEDEQPNAPPYTAEEIASIPGLLQAWGACNQPPEDSTIRSFIPLDGGPPRVVKASQSQHACVEIWDSASGQLLTRLRTAPVKGSGGGPLTFATYTLTDGQPRIVVSYSKSVLAVFDGER